jgi:hypothetical protein
MAERSQNRLFAAFRDWHGWLGILIAALFLVIGTTGIFLNHKNLWPGNPNLNAKPGASNTHALTTATALSAIPVSFEQALARCRQTWGDVPLDNLHLKNENGALVYKFKAPYGRELLVDAMTGEAMEKPRNWAGLMADLHTGKILGENGRLLADLAALALLALTVTGVYLWLMPALRRRKARHANAARQAVATGQTASTGQRFTEMDALPAGRTER